MTTQQAQGGPSSSRPGGRAPRGSACLTCRRRKLRCDGVRPVCGQCIRSNTEADCEYTDGPSKSATQILEENVARLEARIHELEHPEEASASLVRLHDPRSPAQGPSSATSSTSVNPVHPSFANLAQDFAAFAPPMPPANTAEPSAQLTQLLVNHFLNHSDQVGFFLHKPRFLTLVSQRDPNARTARLSPALLNAVYLWGVRLSDNDSLRAQESTFLSRALHFVSTALGHVPPYNITYTIQAEVLLSTYFFSMGRLLEGRYHCSAAVALALGSQLNQIMALSGLIPPDSRFDRVEFGQRVNAFWTVFIVDKGWSVAAGSPSHLNGATGAPVNTLWPLDIEQYETGDLTTQGQDRRTMEAFLHGYPNTASHGPTSLITLRARAAALFERGSRLASQMLSPMTQNANQLLPESLALDNVIDDFTATLPSVELATDRAVARNLILIHTLARVATIHLHSGLEHVQHPRDRKELTAASAAVGTLYHVDLTGLVFVDPILALLWTAVCRVLIGETSRLSSLWTSISESGPGAAGRDRLHYVETRHNGIADALQKVLGAMATFSHVSPLMASQLAIVQQEMGNPAR